MPWHIIQTKPAREIVVAENLVRVGLVSYCPTEAYKVRVNARKHRTALRAMFPGYVFSDFDAAVTWPTSDTVAHMRRVLTFDGQQVTVPDFIIDRIRDTETELRKMNGKKRRAPMLYIGQIACAKSGPMFGFFGIVSAMRRNTVCVEFDFSGRKVKAWFKTDQVSAV